MNLYISDGVLTVYLDGTNEAFTRKGSGYSPRTPDLDLTEVERFGMDGAVVSDAMYRNVRESFDVWFIDPDQVMTPAELRVATNFELSRLFETARRKVRPVYVYYAPDDPVEPEEEVAYYRSPILAGRVIWPRNLHDPGVYERAILPAEIEWTRAPYWEDVTATTIVTAHTVTNDAQAIVLSATAVQGDLATPAILTFDNTYADRVQEIYVAHHLYGAPNNYNPDAGALSGSASDTISEIDRVTLSGTNLTHAGGGWFHPVARFSAKPTDVFFSWALELLGATIWRGDLFAIGTGALHLMGTTAIPLPPWTPSGGTQQSLDLVLYGVSEVGGTVTIDDIYLMPMDGWRELRPSNYGLAAGDALTDDPVAERIVVDWGTVESGHYMSFGSPIMLAPYLVQSLWMLWSTGTVGGAAIAADADITVAYHKRRLTL